MDALYYVADPMCSWCYGFASEWKQARERLGLPVRLVMGGLAPDSDEPMPDETREMVQGAWRAVAQATGATFNFDFWKKCQPRRSTYPACRAVIAAEKLHIGAGEAMFAAVQRAYYTEARNPSDAATLVALAGEIGLDGQRFDGTLASNETESLLEEDLRLARSLGVRSYPTVVLVQGGNAHALASGYETAENVLARYAELDPA